MNPGSVGRSLGAFACFGCAGRFIHLCRFSAGRHAGGRVALQAHAEQGSWMNDAVHSPRVRRSGSALKAVRRRLSRFAGHLSLGRQTCAALRQAVLAPIAPASTSDCWISGLGTEEFPEIAASGDPFELACPAEPCPDRVAGRRIFPLTDSGVATRFGPFARPLADGLTVRHANIANTVGTCLLPKACRTAGDNAPTFKSKSDDVRVCLDSDSLTSSTSCEVVGRVNGERSLCDSGKCQYNEHLVHLHESLTRLLIAIFSTTVLRQLLWRMSNNRKPDALMRQRWLNRSIAHGQSLASAHSDAESFPGNAEFES